ncbi:MAG TPA: hypothetical protein G4O08_07520 [Anaerolineae bacterium]|jgi:hypothetical protein|nr:hypothetical protein [Anaerolineae bacterium]
MKKYWLRAVGGILLIAAGIFQLLDWFNIIPDNILSYIWLLLFLASGVVFVVAYITDRRHWWALIPGFTLIGLGMTISSSLLFADAVGDLGGSLFLGSMALGFWLIFALHRKHWWSGIPAGVLTTLAVVAGTEELTRGLDGGTVFFLGLGLTFLLLYIVPTTRGRMTWPLIPAIILIVMGVLIGTNYVVALNYIGAAALIGVGVYLLVRSLMRSSDDDSEEESG